MSARPGLGFLVAVLLLSACGVPTGAPPTPIAASDVPYGLARTAPSSSPAPTAPPQADQPRVYLVTTGETLVPAPRDVPGGSVGDQLAAVLDDLADGPTAQELAAGLTSALPPGATLTVHGLDGRTATVDIAGPSGAPSGQDSRRAVAQIVLTATSVPGVHGVRLTRDGGPVDAPLPSGRLTADVLTAEDYAGYLIGVPAAPS